MGKIVDKNKNNEHVLFSLLKIENKEISIYSLNFKNHRKTFRNFCFYNEKL